MSTENTYDYIRRTAWTIHRPFGTGKMGPDTDEAAVVDPQLRVRGVAGLRVVDASVMPDMPGGNINAPIIMMTEKATDPIRSNEPLARISHDRHGLRRVQAAARGVAGLNRIFGYAFRPAPGGAVGWTRRRPWRL